MRLTLPNGVSATRRRYDQNPLGMVVGEAFNPTAELKHLARFRTDSAKVANSRPTTMPMFQNHF